MQERAVHQSEIKYWSSVCISVQRIVPLPTCLPPPLFMCIKYWKENIFSSYSDGRLTLVVVGGFSGFFFFGCHFCSGKKSTWRKSLSNLYPNPENKYRQTEINGRWRMGICTFKTSLFHHDEVSMYAYCFSVLLRVVVWPRLVVIYVKHHTRMFNVIGWFRDACLWCRRDGFWIVNHCSHCHPWQPRQLKVAIAAQRWGL